LSFFVCFSTTYSTLRRGARLDDVKTYNNTLCRHLNCVLELMLGAMDVLMIRNLKDDHPGLSKGQYVEEKLGRSQQEKVKSNSTSSPPRSPGPVCTKTDALDASELRLGWDFTDGKLRRLLGTCSQMLRIKNKAT
jgi:hypothetical protein